MTDFNPGDGWHELRDGEVADGDWVQRYYKASMSFTTWVPDVPVPPLPISPYTVIRVTEWKNEDWQDTYGDSNIFFLDLSGFWNGPGMLLDTDDVVNFEIAATPVHEQ